MLTIEPDRMTICNRIAWQPATICLEIYTIIASILQYSVVAWVYKIFAGICEVEVLSLSLSGVSQLNSINKPNEQSVTKYFPFSTSTLSYFSWQMRLVDLILANEGRHLTKKTVKQMKQTAYN